MSVAKNYSKMLKKARPATEQQRRFKEKLRDKLKGDQLQRAAAQLQQHQQQQQYQQQQEQPQIIVTDLGSQKSYIDLTPKLVASSLEQYSRISVIRTALSNQIGEQNDGIDASSYGDLAMDSFYQEKPMDFSPKNKFNSASSGARFEMGRNYTMVS